MSGLFFKFSDTWQLVINTGTTIVTFLMVFLIQNTQNRDAEAIQVKLDELIRSQQGAHNALLDLEELEEVELDQMRRHYVRLAKSARADLRLGKVDTGVCELDTKQKGMSFSCGRRWPPQSRSTAGPAESPSHAFENALRAVFSPVASPSRR
jgi:low affinity Fe/Cu permease